MNGELVRWMFMNIPGYGGAALGKTEDDPIVYFVNDGCMNRNNSSNIFTLSTADSEIINS